jgi:hypothetical protein
VHLSEKVARDRYVDHLIEKGARIEYWDLVPLLFGELDEVGSKKADYLRTPQTYDEIEAMLRLPENEDAYYVMLIHYEGRFAKLFRLLSKYECRMLSISWGALPIRDRGGRLRQAFSAFSANPLRLLEKTLGKVRAVAYRKLNLIKPFDIVFAAGQVLMATKHHAVKVVPINLVDYDHYMRAKFEDCRIVEGRYAVFLDVFLPGHPDLKVIGRPAVNPQAYYSSLNRFFSLLEVTHGIKVVVAAHPKADYSNNPFQGRDIYRDLTAKLVKDADFVVSHHSTSISYAVLNHKPIVFVYTDEMVSVYGDTIVDYLLYFADYLGAAIYNIDAITLDEPIVIGGANLERYESYKYNFLTTKSSEHATTQDIFWREINVG